MDQETALNLLVAVFSQIDLKPLAKSLQCSITITEEPTRTSEFIPDFDTFLSRASRIETRMQLCREILFYIIFGIQWLCNLPGERKVNIFLGVLLFVAIKKMLPWEEYDCKYDWEKGKGQYQLFHCSSS